MAVRKRHEAGDTTAALSAKRRRTSGAASAAAAAAATGAGATAAGAGAGAASRRAAAAQPECPISPNSSDEQLPPSLDLATPTPSASGSPPGHSSEDDSDADMDSVGVSSPPTLGAAAEEEERMDGGDGCLAGVDRLRAIISQQFDLEILLKHRELVRIEDEISKIHSMMLQMRQYSQHEPEQAVGAEPAGFVDIYAQYLGRPGQQQPEQCIAASAAAAVHHGVYTRESSSQLAALDPLMEDLYGPRPQRSSTLRAQNKVTHNSCLYRRADGIIVKLVCPKCNRSNFGSVQGFINHCRISHTLEFNSHDAAAAVCGVAIDDQDSAAAMAPAESQSHSQSQSQSPAPAEGAAAAAAAAETSTNGNTNGNTNSNTNGRANGCAATASAGSAAGSANGIPRKEKISYLANYLRGKVDVDLEALVAHATEKVTKGYLFEGEEDFEEPEIPLSENCSTFERVLAEARKLHLNVDEIRAAAAQAASTDQERQKKKRKNSSTSTNAKPKESPAKLSPALRCEDGWGSRASSPHEPLFPSPSANRRMPTEAQPLVTRSKSRQQATQRPPTPPSSEDGNKKDKEMNMIGNMAKYIQLSRFF